MYYKEEYICENNEFRQLLGNTKSSTSNKRGFHTKKEIIELRDGIRKDHPNIDFVVHHVRNTDDDVWIIPSSVHNKIMNNVASTVFSEMTENKTEQEKKNLRANARVVSLVEKINALIGLLNQCVETQYSLLEPPKSVTDDKDIQQLLDRGIFSVQDGSVQSKCEEITWEICNKLDDMKQYIYRVQKDQSGKYTVNKVYENYNTEVKTGMNPMNESRPRTRKELRVLQGNYGYGWDDLCEYEITGDFEKDKETFKEIRDDVKAYRENEPQYEHRVITRFEKKIVTESIHNDDEIKDAVDGKIIDFGDNGYYYVEYDGKNLYAGSATNVGIIHEYEVEYDHDKSIDENLYALYDKIIDENPEFLTAESLNEDVDVSDGDFEGIEIAGWEDTWSEIDRVTVPNDRGGETTYHLMENDEWGDETNLLVISDDQTEVYDTYDDILTTLADNDVIDYEDIAKYSEEREEQDREPLYGTVYAWYKEEYPDDYQLERLDKSTTFNQIKLGREANMDLEVLLSETEDGVDQHVIDRVVAHLDKILGEGNLDEGLKDTLLDAGEKIATKLGSIHAKKVYGRLLDKLLPLLAKRDLTGAKKLVSEVGSKHEKALDWSEGYDDKIRDLKDDLADISKGLQKGRSIEKSVDTLLNDIRKDREVPDEVEIAMMTMRPVIEGK